MYRMVITSTGDEEFFNNFTELAFAVLDCYDSANADLFTDILHKLADFKEDGRAFMTEENGVYVEKIAE